MPVVFGQKPEEAPKPETKKPKKEAEPAASNVVAFAPVAHDSGWQNPDKPTSVPGTVGKQGVIHTSVEHPDGAHEAETEHVGQFIVAQAPLCTVGVGAGATMNMGNYQSLRVNVFCSIPCEKKHLDATYESAAEFVEHKLNTLMEKLAPGQGNAG